MVYNSIFNWVIVNIRNVLLVKVHVTAYEGFRDKKDISSFEEFYFIDLHSTFNNSYHWKMYALLL